MELVLAWVVAIEEDEQVVSGEFAVGGLLVAGRAAGFVGFHKKQARFLWLPAGLGARAADCGSVDSSSSIT